MSKSRLKYTTEDARGIVGNIGLELLSSYKGINKKLTLKDKDGYFYYCNLGGILQNYFPSKFKNNIYALQNLKLWFKLNKNQFELIDNEYKKSLHKLVFKDRKGYYYTSSFANLQQGREPSKFHHNNPYTIQNIKLWCKLNNKPFELVSDIYIKNTFKLKWKCLMQECGDIFFLKSF